MVVPKFFVIVQENPKSSKSLFYIFLPYVMMTHITLVKR